MEVKTEDNGQDKIKTIDIDSLKEGIPVITEGLFGIHKEACIVCLAGNGYYSGVKMELLFDDDKRDICQVIYSGDMSTRLLKSYSDNNKTTDYGAGTIALLLIREYTDFVAERASNPIGNGFDYYLIDKNEDYDDERIYNHSAYLEVSGIRKETKHNSVNKRIQDKLRRLERYKHDFSCPIYIIVVEFSKPYTKIYGLSI